VDGDQVVLGVKAVHLDQSASAGRPVDHHQRDVVIGVDLGPLPEVLGVMDRQRMETEGVPEQPVRRALIHVGKVQPEAG
jgi:hypothetical protein